MHYNYLDQQIPKKMESYQTTLAKEILKAD